jgi:transposase
MDTIGGVVAVARRTRRFWSEEEKRRIVAQTYAPGVSVSQVGRRYDVNANLIFTWRRDPL